jgi:hypothetical protein
VLKAQASLGIVDLVTRETQVGQEPDDGSALEDRLELTDPGMSKLENAFRDLTGEAIPRAGDGAFVLVDRENPDLAP